MNFRIAGSRETLSFEPQALIIAGALSHSDVASDAGACNRRKDAPAEPLASFRSLSYSLKPILSQERELHRKPIAYFAGSSFSNCSFKRCVANGFGTT